MTNRPSEPTPQPRAASGHPSPEELAAYIRRARELRAQTMSAALRSLFRAPARSVDAVAQAGPGDAAPAKRDAAA